MKRSIEVEVEHNENTYGVPLRIFSATAEPYQISHIKMDVRGQTGIPHSVTGWSSADGGSSCPAYCVSVEDSGAALSYLVFGGDWGLRFKPADSVQGWGHGNEDQFGEPCLLLADLSDITPRT